MDISIIIPVLNGSEYIETLLNSLSIQRTDKKYEVIVVDNDSDDNTVEIAKKNGAKVLHKERGYYISSVRNEGVKNAQGEIISFIDVDCEVEKDWLSQGFNILKKNDDIGIIGGQYVCPKKSTWVQRAWESVRQRGSHDVNFVTSGNFFIKKDIFNEFGGFNENLETGEDYDLCLRVSKKYRIISDDKINVVHYGDPTTLMQRLQKEIWYGKNIKQILRNKPLYLPFWASIIFGLCNIVLLLGLILTNKWMILLSLLNIGLLLSGISFIRCMKVKKFQYYFQLIIIYWFYLLGRTISLTLNFFKK